MTYRDLVYPWKGGRGRDEVDRDGVFWVTKRDVEQRIRKGLPDGCVWGFFFVSYT